MIDLSRDNDTNLDVSSVVLIYAVLYDYYVNQGEVHSDIVETEELMLEHTLSISKRLIVYMYIMTTNPLLMYACVLLSIFFHIAVTRTCDPLVLHFLRYLRV